MRGRTHAAVAATLGLGLSVLAQQDDKALLVATGLAALGGLLPDVDEPESLIGHSPKIAAKSAARQFRRGNPVRILILGMGELLTGVTKALATVIREVCGHRGATHWLLLAFVFSAPILFLAGVLEALYFFVGYLSHLALDMMTKSGVPILGPLTRRRLHLLPVPLRVRTGGWVDHLLQFSTGIAYVAILARSALGEKALTWLNTL